MRNNISIVAALALIASPAFGQNAPAQSARNGPVLAFVPGVLVELHQVTTKLLETLDRVATRQNKELYRETISRMNRQFAGNAGEIAFLQSGLARTITFEAVQLTRSDAPGTFTVHRYVGRGENAQDAYNIRTAETPRFFEVDTVVREAREALGPRSANIALGVVRRIAVTAKYDISSGKLSFTPTMETAAMIKEATVFSKMLNPNVLVPLASVAELERLRLAQNAYEDSVADLLSAQEAAELSSLTAARDRVASNLRTAIEVYDRAVAEAREAAGIALMGSLLSLGGQVASSIESSRAASTLNDRLRDVEQKLGTAQSELAALNGEVAKISKKVAELGRKLPNGYGIINLNLFQQIYVPPVIPHKEYIPDPR